MNRDNRGNIDAGNLDTSGLSTNFAYIGGQLLKYITEYSIKMLLLF